MARIHCEVIIASIHWVCSFQCSKIQIIVLTIFIYFLEIKKTLLYYMLLILCLVKLHHIWIYVIQDLCYYIYCFDFSPYISFDVSTVHETLKDMKYKIITKILSPCSHDSLLWLDFPLNWSCILIMYLAYIGEGFNCLSLKSLVGYFMRLLSFLYETNPLFLYLLYELLMRVDLLILCGMSKKLTTTKLYQRFSI